MGFDGISFWQVLILAVLAGAFYTPKLIASYERSKARRLTQANKVDEDNNLADFSGFEEAINEWNSKPDGDGEKIFWLSEYEGDAEKAKWAFIRSKASNDKLPKGLMSRNASEGYLSRVWRGDVNLWLLWVWSAWVPGVVVMLSKSSGVLVQNGLFFVFMVLFFLYARACYLKYKGAPGSVKKWLLWGYVGLNSLFLFLAAFMYVVGLFRS